MRGTRRTSSAASPPAEPRTTCARSPLYTPRATRTNWPREKATRAEDTRSEAVICGTGTSVMASGFQP